MPCCWLTRTYVGKQVERFCATSRYPLRTAYLYFVQPALLHKTGAHRYEEVWLAPLPCQSGSGLHPWEAPSGEKEDAEAEEANRTGQDRLQEHRHTRCPLRGGRLRLRAALGLLNSVPP